MSASTPNAPFPASGGQTNPSTAGSPPPAGPSTSTGGGGGGGPRRRPFQTDVNRPTALPTATFRNIFVPGFSPPPGSKLRRPDGVAASPGVVGGTGGVGGTAGASGRESGEGEEEEEEWSEEQLLKMEEEVNQYVDREVGALVDGMKDLIRISQMKDKDKVRVAQEAFQAEVRAENMVRAVQSLTSLSQSLKLTLLLRSLPSTRSPKQESAVLAEEMRARKGEMLRGLEGVLDTMRDMAEVPAHVPQSDQLVEKGEGEEGGGERDGTDRPTDQAPTSAEQGKETRSGEKAEASESIVEEKKKEAIIVED